MSFMDLMKVKTPVMLEKDAAVAQKWFRDRAGEFKASDIKESSLMRASSGQFRNKPFPGHCYTFFYDPKGKDTLPYYDRFPLVFPFAVDATGFTGLNVHYLPPPLRAHLLDGLLEVTNNKNYDETTKLKISYQALQSAARFKYFAPTVKRYLHSHLRSRLVHISPSEWNFVVMLPTQRFVGATAQQVWKDSKAMF